MRDFWSEIYNDAHLDDQCNNLKIKKTFLCCVVFLRASNTSESYLEGKGCVCRKISKPIDNVHFKMDNFDSKFDKCLLRG